MSEAGLTEEAEVAPSPSPPLSPRRSHPAQSGETFDALFNAPADKQSGETFDGPPTLERSGSERRGGAVTSPVP